MEKENVKGWTSSERERYREKCAALLVFMMNMSTPNFKNSFSFKTAYDIGSFILMLQGLLSEVNNYPVTQYFLLCTSKFHYRKRLQRIVN
jgi:hypothetical protein